MRWTNLSTFCLRRVYLPQAQFFTSCDDGDDDNTANPAEEVVKASKKHDTAILLCTFGSTFKESIKTYDATLADFQNAFPDADIYLSFTSRTCVNRVEAETGIARYQPDLWLQDSRKCRLQEGSGTVLTHHPGWGIPKLDEYGREEEIHDRVFPECSSRKKPLFGVRQRGCGSRSESPIQPLQW